MSNADFQPVLADEGLKLLKEGCKTVAEGKVWTKSQIAGFSTQFLVLNLENQTLQVAPPLSAADLEFFLNGIIASGDRECFINANLAKATVFFKVPFIGAEQGRLTFGIPKQVYKVQRRQYLRLPIPDGFVLKAEFILPLLADQKFLKKIIDLSAGGMGIEVTQEESLNFIPELKIPSIRFLLRSKQITAQGIVKHSRPINEGHRFKGIKIGIQLENLAQEDKNHIDQYVQTEARRFFTTLD